LSQVQASGSAGKKTVPVWSLFLVALLVLGSVLGVFIADPQLVNALSPKPTPPIKDFTLTSSQTSLGMKQGASSTTVLSVASLNGFNNATALSVSMPANGTGMLTPTLNPTILTPTAGGKANSTLIVSVGYSAPMGNYVITVTATTGAKTHSIQLTVVVSPVPDFAISVSPSAMIVARGGTSAANLTLTSRSGFTGNVSLTITAPFAFLGVAGGVSPLFLASNGSNKTVFAVSTSNITAVGTYALTVSGASGSVSRSIQVPVNVTSVFVGTESLGLDSYSFSSNNTVVTLNIRNRGTTSVTLATYYVKDASGDQYANVAWPGPTIAPGSVAAVNVKINVSCGSSCTLTGTAFTFTAGNSYTILFVTSRNNQFWFTVVR
jgi:uncharacterized membrane protein